MSDNVNIIVQDTINEIVVNTAVIVETIDINVQTPIDEVTIITNPNNYIVNINRIIGEQVQSDWNQNDSQEPDYIKNKPTIPGAQEQSDWNETDINKPPYIKNKPAIPTQTSDLINNGDGSSGSYFLTEANIIPQVNSDWNAVGGKAEIFNKPTIPAEQVNSDWNATSGKAQILNKPTIPSIAGLATTTYVDQQDALKVDKVAGYGLSQNDFTNTLKTKLDGIEAGAQVNVNADWNATTGDAEILNKPTIPSITNLVPYTGANADVVLGLNNLFVGGRDEVTINQTGISVVDDGLGPSQEVTIAPNEIIVRDLSNNQDVRILSYGIQFFDSSFQQTAFPPTGGTSSQYIKGDGTIATFPTIPAAQVNSDWNATSGKAQILNKPTIPAAQVNSDWNSTSGVSQILNKPTIPSISGLELQANKQNSLAVDGTGVKYPTVDAVNLGIENVNTNAIDRISVKLATAINKGQAVYVSSANGTNIIVSKASNTSELTSSKTIGLLETTGDINAIVNVVTDGLLSGLNTSTATIGDPVWLGTNGNLIYGLINKPYAPAHLVYIGVVTRVNTNNGEILIKVQNGFELREIHDVDLITSTPINNQLLSYDSGTSLWRNKSVTTSEIADSNNKRYVTDANLTTIGNQSGTNTGDETTTTIKTKLSPTVTASGLLAQGTILTPTLIAAANNDVLIGLDLTPTFTNGAFTSLSNYAIRHTGDIVSSVSNSYNLGGVAMPYNTIYTRIIRDITQISYRSDNQGWFNNANTQTAKLFSTGNLVLQNGGTFTDLPSARLQVNSTTQGMLAPRMTNAQKIAISSPATGLLAYDTDLSTLSQYNGSAWVAPYKYINTTQSTVTGTTTETIMATATINSNTFNSSDIMKILFEVSKTTVLVAPTLRIRINTTNTLSGATTIGTYTMPAANTFALMQRNFLLSATNLSGFSFTTTSLTDIVTAAIPSNSTTYNTTSVLYLFFTIQLGNTLDQVSFTMGNITN